MDCEPNADSIRALEEQIREHERAIVRLKRARNSLLNVSKIPPEVLGNIFRWNVALKGDFDELDKRSHNFLLVCHHWFEVASRTPEVWSFWGNTLKDWARWCRRTGTVPLDLVLDCNDRYDSDFNTTLRNVLQDRATRDTIRRVHLISDSSALLNSIIASLTPNHEELRSNSIESLVLQNGSEMPMDVSDFFANQRFPKLRRLELTNCTISPWNHLTSRTSALTTLNLNLSNPSLSPTTSQLFSILASNPTLQHLGLVEHGIPNDGGNGSSSRAQLRHLKGLKLEGGLRHIIKLLHQLDHPRDMDDLSLSLYGCDIADIPQVIGPYLQDYLQRRNKPRNGLKVAVYSSHYISTAAHIRLHVGGAEDVPAQARENAFVTIIVLLDGIRQENILKGATLDLITHIPREEVVHFGAYCTAIPTEGACTRFPNLRVLSFELMPLFAVFPDPLIEDGKILPSLEHVLLKDVFENNGDWSPLLTFLGRRLSSGNRLDTLVVARCSHVCQEVVNDIKGMVRELNIDCQNTMCPFGTC